MNNVFVTFLSLSLSGSLLILGLFICKPLIKSKLSRQWQYYVWLIVIARLLLPIAPMGNLMDVAFHTIQSVSYSDETQTTQSNLIDANTEYGGAEEQDSNLAESDTPPEILQKAPSNPSLIQEVFGLFKENYWLLWIAVAVVLLIRKITIYTGFVRFVKVGAQPVSDMELLDRVAVIGEQLHIRRAVELCVNPLVSSPLLFGLLRPCIVIPSADLSDLDFHNTILHELTHYKRRDMFYKWLTQITICLHWFNPLVYLMGREINKACEFSCDEAVITKIGADNAPDYGNTLLESMAAVGHYKEYLASVTLSENKKLLKERLDMIMNFKKKSRLAVCVTLLLTVALLCGFTFSGVYKAKAVELSEIINSDIRSYLIDSGVDSYNQVPNPDIYDHYSTYGIAISKDGKDLIYNGQKVRLFVDEHSDWYMAPMAFYLNESGKIDLSVIRNSAGEITGIESISEEKARYFVDLFFTSDLGEQTLIKAEEKLYELEQYHAYGVTFSINNDMMYYNNQRVRIFGFESAVDSDFITLWSDPNGTIDLSAVRNVSGEITGIEPLAEEKVHELVEELLLTEDTNKYQKYQSYGIAYSKDNQTLSYNGQTARLFVDQHIDGFYEAFWEDKRGTVDLAVIRSASDVITGIEVIPEEAADKLRIESPADNESIIPVSDNTDPVNASYISFNQTSAAKQLSADAESSGKFFSTARIDIVDTSGVAHQAMAYLCNRSDSYRQTFDSAMEQLSAAYPNSGGKIKGYLELIRDNRLRNYGDQDFSAIEKIVLTDANGVQRNAYVIAICGSDRFVKPYEDILEPLMETYSQLYEYQYDSKESSGLDYYENDDVYTDFSQTIVARNWSGKAMEIKHSHWFGWDNVGVIDESGIVHPAVVFAFSGSDSYKRKLSDELEKLYKAYPNSNTVSGYMDNPYGSDPRQYKNQNYSAVIKTSVSDINGVQADAYIVAISGSDDFMNAYDTFSDTIVDSYFQK